SRHADRPAKDTFEVLHTSGDGRNGNPMNVTQDGILVATRTGPANEDDTNPVSVTITLCNNMPLELFWNTGGSFPGEVGVTIKNQDGTVIFVKNPGSGSQGTMLFEGTVECVPFTCPKPVQLQVTNIDEDSAILSWTESGTATVWEIYVVPWGSPAPTTATSGIQVTENPYEYEGLDSGTVYAFYVRAICAEDDISNWSGPLKYNTPIVNDECIVAIEVPVKPDQSCPETVGGTVIAATASAGATGCFGT